MGGFRRFVELTCLVTLSELAVGAASVLADPQVAHNAYVWVTQNDDRSAALGRLFLVMGALGLICGVTTAAASLTFEIFRSRTRD